MNSKYKRNIWLLYIIIFFHNLIPAYVIERLFWQERGMTVQLVIWCEVIYAATVIALELPSGILADRFGRKNLVILSSVIGATEFILLLFSYKFWHFGAVVFLAGISKASSSGAWNALLYDSLLTEGREEQFVKILGRLQSIDFLAAMLAALSGGFLAAKYGLNFNYYLSIISTVVAMLVSFLLHEPPIRSDQNDEPQKIRQIALLAWSFFKEHLDASVILLQSMLIAACVIYVDEFWQIYLGDTGFPIALFGVCSAAFTLARIPGSLIADRLLGFLSHAKILILTTVCGSIGVIFAGTQQSNYGIAGFLVLFFCAGLVEPICSGYIHQRADSKARATIDSVSSLLERIFTIAIGLAFGYVASNFSIFNAYTLLGSLLLISAPIFGRLYSRRSKT